MTGSQISSPSTSTATKSATRPTLGYANCSQSQPSGGNLPSNVIGCSSVAFQQVKQTQASLARLSRHIHQSQQPQQIQSLVGNSSHHQPKQAQMTHQDASNNAAPIQSQIKSTSFVDCLIRRFKDCFNENCCTVPMFVVGNLSPGSDGK